MFGKFWIILKGGWGGFLSPSSSTSTHMAEKRREALHPRRGGGPWRREDGGWRFGRGLGTYLACLACCNHCALPGPVSSPSDSDVHYYYLPILHMPCPFPLTFSCTCPYPSLPHTLPASLYPFTHLPLTVTFTFSVLLAVLPLLPTHPLPHLFVTHTPHTHTYYSCAPLPLPFCFPFAFTCQL